jgi:hypothetical protein
MVLHIYICSIAHSWMRRAYRLLLLRLLASAV